MSVVLPRYLFDQGEIRRGLSDVIIRDLPDATRVTPQDECSLVEALARQMTDDDYPPVVLTDLLLHPEVEDRRWVLDAADLTPEQQHELPEVMSRMALDSKSIPIPSRSSFVVIMSAECLPSFPGSEHGDVTHTTCWYWNRMARWDVSAHVAITAGRTETKPTVTEVRNEIIVELSRWDLALATRLVEQWDGDLESLSELVGRSEEGSPIPESGRRFRDQPPEGLMEAWDEGRVDVWHNALSLAPRHEDEQSLQRCIWNAQARVLLPWVESMRNRVEVAAERLLSRGRFQSAVKRCATDDNGWSEGSVIEIGLLEKSTLR